MSRNSPERASFLYSIGVSRLHVDIESHPSVRPIGSRRAGSVPFEATRSLPVPLLRDDVRLEAVERRGERDTRFRPPARGQRLAIASRAGIGEVSFDQRGQAQALVQLAQQQEPGIGRHGRAPELVAKLGLNEREIGPDVASPLRGALRAPARSP